MILHDRESGRLSSQKDSPQLEEWLDAFANVFRASRLPSTSYDVDRLLREIVNNARKLSGADFVLLYEYFDERKDIQLPPTIAGSVIDEEVLRGRGIATEHKSSAVFRLLKSQKPFYAEDAPREWTQASMTRPQPGERPFFVREGVISSAGIPLQIEEELVGVLFINYRTEHSFTPKVKELLELFAKQAALAIGNARFFLRSERYSRKLEILNQLGRELSGAVDRDIEQIGKLIHDHLQLVIPTRNFFVCTYEPDRSHFALPYLWDEHDSRNVLEPRLHQGLTGRVCRTGQPLFATRETQQQLFREGAATLVGEPSAVWLGAPLIVRDKVIGALVVQDYQDETAFTEEHLQFLIALASQAAIAIDNYRLLQDAKLRLDELSALLEISQQFATRRVESTTEMLSRILDHLCRFALADGSLLLLVDPGNKQELKVTAASSELRRYLGKSLGHDDGVSGEVARTGVHKIENHYRDWPGRCEIFDPPPKRVCAVPLVWKDEVIGVMTLSSDQEAGRFSLREIEILKRFASATAVALQSSRESLFRQVLIHAGPNAIIAVDKKGRITEMNKEASDLFQYGSEAELKGESVTRLYWGGLEEARKIQDLLWPKGKIQGEEVFGRSRDNDKIPLALSAALLRDENDEVMGSVGILKDLRIQALRGRTELLVDALREISSEEDLEKITDLVVYNAVQLLYADAGCLFLIEEDVFQVRAPWGHDEEHLAALRLGRGRDRLQELEATDRRKTLFLRENEIGEVRLLPDSRSAVLVPIRTDTRLLAFLLIESRTANQFSADLKLLEILASQAAVSINRVQLLRYREKIQGGLQLSANAIAVGQVATSFMHEAKNALHGMSLIVRSLSEDLERDSSIPGNKSYLQRLELLKSELGRFDQLSRRLQKFTHQGLQPELTQVYINETVRYTVQLLGSALRSKGVKHELRLDSSLDPPTGKGEGNPVLIDESQIQQVLMNLILNALDASSARQPLLIETRNHPENVEIRVTDYGTGIRSEVRRKLFKPFATTKKEGVGLGLFLSRILVEDKHRGSIELLGGAPGKGTTFSVRLRKGS